MFKEACEILNVKHVFTNPTYNRLMVRQNDLYWHYYESGLTQEAIHLPNKEICILIPIYICITGIDPTEAYTLFLSSADWRKTVTTYRLPTTSKPSQTFATLELSILTISRPYPVDVLSKYSKYCVLCETKSFYSQSIANTRFWLYLYIYVNYSSFCEFCYDGSFNTNPVTCIQTCKPTFDHSVANYWELRWRTMLAQRLDFDAWDGFKYRLWIRQCCAEVRINRWNILRRTRNKQTWGHYEHINRKIYS